MNKLLPFVVGAAALALVSCQGTDPRAASMNYSDAVTRLDQVDPAYRAYFRDQQGSSYGVEEQRKALAAAVQTYRTPVPTVAANVEDRPLASRRSTTAARKSIAGTRKATAKGRTALAKGKTSAANKKAVAKKSAAPKKKSGKALAVNTKKRR